MAVDTKQKCFCSVEIFYVFKIKKKLVGHSAMLYMLSVPSTDRGVYKGG